MATYKAGTTYDGYTIRLDVWESDINTQANTSVVNWAAYIVNGGRRFSISSFSYKVQINGSWVADYYGSCNTTDVAASGGVHGLGSGSITVSHDSDGNKTVYCYITCDGRSNGHGPGWGAADGNFTLSKINRYANITRHTVTGTTEHTITVGWSTDATRDWTQYSLNGGGWTDAGDTGTTSGSYTLRNLNPGQQYSIKTRVRRQDSGLWTESGVIYGTCKDCVIRNKINGTWKSCVPYIKVNGTWKKAIPYMKVNGSWKEGIN